MTVVSKCPWGQNVPGSKCAGSKFFGVKVCRVKNVWGQSVWGQRCSGSKCAGSKMFGVKVCGVYVCQGQSVLGVKSMPGVKVSLGSKCLRGQSVFGVKMGGSPIKA